MFKQSIVFVIGAGASVEYGLPTGADLLRKISSAVGDVVGSEWGDPELNQSIATLFRGEFSSYEAAAVDLRKFISSGVSSIDDALTWFSSRQRVIDLGKIAIVNEILKAERGSQLHGPQLMTDPETNFRNTWVPNILSMVMDGRKNEDAETAFANVTFINFNYDRTIEHFLYTSLQSKFGLNEPRAKSIVVGLNMFRPYGTVGMLPWEANNGVAFGARPEPTLLLAASKNIKTFSEGTTGTLQSQIRSSLEKARVVVFLGFGFHTQNMELIRVTRTEQWKRAYATAVGLKHANIGVVGQFIAMTVGCPVDPGPMLLDWRAHVLLTDLRPAIMAAASM